MQSQPMRWESKPGPVPGSAVLMLGFIGCAPVAMYALSQRPAGIVWTCLWDADIASGKAVACAAWDGPFKEFEAAVQSAITHGERAP